MAKTKKPAARGMSRPASTGVVLAIDTSEDSETLTIKQAAWLCRRLGLAPERARLLASLAFSGGRA